MSDDKMKEEMKPFHEKTEGWDPHEMDQAHNHLMMAAKIKGNPNLMKAVMDKMTSDHHAIRSIGQLKMRASKRIKEIQTEKESPSEDKAEPKGAEKKEKKLGY